MSITLVKDAPHDRGVEEVRAKGDEDGRVCVYNDAAVPLQVTTPPGMALTVSLAGSPDSIIVDDRDAGCAKALGASAIYTLPVPGDLYTIIVKGGTAYLLGGNGAQIATTEIGVGFTMTVDDQYSLTVRLRGPTIAYLGTSGWISFLHHDPAL